MSIQDEDEPLDPTLERVRRKMLRLMIISIGIMMIGLMAVLFAIVYKISSPGGSKSAGDEVAPVSIALPAGAKFLSSTLQGERILIETQLPSGDRELMVIHADSGTVQSRMILKPE